MTNNDNARDPYETLGISRMASSDEIHEAYRKLALLNHPDRHPDRPEEYEQKFKDIGEAFYKLCGHDKKTSPDQKPPEDTDATAENQEEQSTSNTPPPWWQYYRGSAPYPGDEFFTWTNQAPGWWVVMWGGPYPGDKFFSDTKRSAKKNGYEPEEPSPTKPGVSLTNVFKTTAIACLITYLATAAIITVLWLFGSFVLILVTKHWLVSTTAAVLLTTLIPPAIFFVLKICKSDFTNEWDWEEYRNFVGLEIVGIIVVLSVLFTLSRPPVFAFLRQHVIGLSLAVVAISLIVATIREMIKRRN